MKKKKLRIRDKDWCVLEVELSPEGRLSICGVAGVVCNCRTAKGAARFVIASDGEYHGLDVYHEVDAPKGKVLVGHSWGQIQETLLDFFPEVEPYLKWHLNDMRAECEHQESRGETWKAHSPSLRPPVCPDCGHRLGHAWLKRELPPEVIAWVESL